MLYKNNEKPARKSLEIVHEGVNFDFCRRVTLFELSNGLYRVKMETYVSPKKKKDEY